MTSGAINMGFSPLLFNSPFLYCSNTLKALPGPVNSLQGVSVFSA